jgi:small-conductance mechanosensitive channel
MRRFYHLLNVVFAVLVTCASLAVAGTAFGQEPSAAPASSSPSPVLSEMVQPPAPAPPPSAPAPASASASAPAGSASAKATAATSEIRVREKVIYTVRVSRGDRKPQDRAKAANDAITSLLGHPEEIGDVRHEEQQGVAVVYVGKTPIVTLGPEDAEASGDANVGVLAAQVTSRLSDAMGTERKRSVIATTVFSFSLLIFSALIAFLLLQRTSDVAARMRGWLVDDPEKITAVRLGKIEFVSAGAARGTLSVALTLGYRLIQLAIAYGWLILALSLFDATRGYTQKLTGIMVTPLYALASRIGGALPLVVVAAIALVAVLVLIRFVGLFFDSVARGDTRVAWLPRDLAQPTSVVVRAGIVVIALVLASPMITGNEDGALSRVGLVALLSIALAGTPLLACWAIGIVFVFARRFRKGELVEFGGRSGRVMRIGPFELHLEDAAATEISVPLVLGLVHPTRIHRHPPLGSIDVVLDAAASQVEIEKALLEAARELSTRAKVELLYIDDGGAHWRVTSAMSRGDNTLVKAVQSAIEKLGVGLGRGPSRRAPASERGASTS